MLRSGPDAFFDVDPSSATPSGCPKWGGPAPAAPFTQLEFIFDTGSDDFRSGSELDVDIFDASGNNIEHGVLHSVGETKFDNDTEHVVVYTLKNSSIPFTSIRNVQLTFIPEKIFCGLGDCSHDEWHAQAIDIYGIRSSSNWEQTCLFVGHEADSSVAEFNFNNDNRIKSLAQGSGCP